ncbi:uncharacterized protein B0T23DRAFT_347672 [Neurospora hispaniola]|uniref:Uncharacterized protein n=1 Tax=Neurospora hispaniola TaxID=588809 RepID=A0AAJ0HZH7_9PEZI|nr:hypothetical protein B0T23DRAFT_347672 [Neurospora hispaniola]
MDDSDSDSDSYISDTSTVDFDQHRASPTSNSDTTSYAPMLIEATEDAQKLQKMSLELASARMEIMKLKAAGQTQEAVIQKLRATLEKERKRIAAGQDEALQQHKDTIRRLGEEYTTAVAENNEEEHANSVMTALRLEVAGLRTSLDLTEQHRDQAVSNNIDLQQPNEDLRWALAAHRREIEKLCGAENKMARIEKVFKESFKNAGTSLISINGVYDLEGSLQLLLERDKFRAKELDDVKKQLLKAKNAKPSEEGNHQRPRKWWWMSFDWMKTERYLWRGKKTE